MHPLKTPSFLKSRPSSPAPIRVDHPGQDASANVASPLPRRPLTKLQNPFRRSASASPAPTRSTKTSPPLVSCETLSATGGPLDLVGLRFAEAVSKALATPSSSAGAHVSSSDPAASVLRGRKPFPPGRGAAVGLLITAELKAASNDIQLYRTIVRIVHRPLSVLLTNLSSLLLPLLPFIELSAPAQVHAVGLATIAAEVLESMKGLGLGGGNEAVSVTARNSECLRGVRDGFESLVQRVVLPLVSISRRELSPIIEHLIDPVSSAADSHAVAALASIMPTTSQRMARVTSVPGDASQTALASLLIGLVWRSLVALSSRPLPEAWTPVVASSKSKGKKELLSLTRSSASLGAASITSSTAVPSTSSSPTNTPPTTPRFASRLPLPSLSRPPSPTSSSKHAPKTSHPLQQLLADTQATFSLLSSLPRPARGSDAAEAVDEAFDALSAFLTFLRSLPCSPLTLDWLTLNTKEAPTLIVLPVLLQLVHPGYRIPHLLGMDDAEYREGCLAGFGRAEVCAGAVGRGVLEQLGISGASVPEMDALCMWLGDRVHDADEEHGRA